MTKELTTRQQMSELGKNIVSAAQESQREAVRKQVLSQVATILSRISYAESQMEMHVQHVRIFRAQIAALEHGEFTIKNGVIVFNDASLTSNF